MWLERKAVLHEEDLDSQFNAAIFLAAHTVEAAWDAFISCCFSYVGFPEKLRVDRGSCSTSMRWSRRFDDVGTEIQLSEVEYKNCIGIEAGQQIAAHNAESYY